jgi:hypothetical protein
MPFSGILKRFHGHEPEAHIQKFMDKHTHSLGTLENLRKTGGKSAGVFVRLPSDERAVMIGTILDHYGYAGLSREDKGLVRIFLQESTGYSRAQVARYITAHQRTPVVALPAPVLTRVTTPMWIPQWSEWSEWKRRALPFASLAFLLLLSSAIGSQSTGDVLRVLNAEQTSITRSDLHAAALKQSTSRQFVVNAVVPNNQTGAFLPLLAISELDVTGANGSTARETLVTWSLEDLLRRVNQRRIARMRLTEDGRTAARPDILIEKEQYPFYPTTEHAAAPAVWDLPLGGKEGQIITIKDGKIIWHDFPYLEQIRSQAPHGTEQTRRAGGNRSGGAQQTTVTNTTTIIQQVGGSSGWTDGDAVVYLTTGTDSVGIGTDAPDTTLEVVGAVSGSSLHAQDSITSSGTLVWEGAASGASLYIASSIQGAGLTDCDASSSKLLYDVTTGRFSCGTDQTAGSGLGVTEGDERYVNTSGDAMTGALTINLTTGTVGLEVIQTISGSTIVANTSLRSSGSLVWEGAASGATLWVSTFEGAGLTDCDASTNKIIWDDTLNRFSCSTDLNTGATYTAGQGLSLSAGNVFTLNSTITGALVRFTTLSGSTVYAKNQLASSGTLVTESGAFISGQMHVIQNGGTLGTDEIQISHDGSNGTIQSKDGSIRLVAGGITGLEVTNEGRIKPFYGIIQAQNEWALSDTTNLWQFGSGLRMNWASTASYAGAAADVGLARLSAGILKVTDGSTGMGSLYAGAMSGYTLKAQKSLASSGTLVWEGAASGATLWVSTFEGAGLTDCDASTNKIIWDDTLNRFSCSTDLNTGATYTAGQGLSLSAGNVFTLNSTITGALVRFDTVSGSTLYAKNLLASSGTLVTESGAFISGQMHVIQNGGTLGTHEVEIRHNGTNGFITSKTGQLQLSASDGSVVYSNGNFQVNGYIIVNGAGVQINNATGYKAASTSVLGWTPSDATGTIDSALARLSAGVVKVTNGSTGMGSLYAGTLSGYTLKAQQSLASSGTLVWEGAASGATLYVATSMQGAGLTDCDAAAQALKWDASTGRFSCGSAGSTYTAGQGLTLNGSDAFSLNTTITGALVRFTTLSGSTVYAKNQLTASGKTIIELSNASDVGLTVRGAANQSANLMEFQNSAGTSLVTLNGSGTILSMPGGFAIGGGYHGTNPAMTGSVIMGYNAANNNSAGVSNVIIGNGAKVVSAGIIGGLNVVIGNNASAKDYRNIVIGDTATSTNGNSSIVIGYNSTTAATSTTTLGTNNTNNASFGLALGYGHTLTNPYAMGFGLGVTSDADGMIGFGTQTGNPDIRLMRLNNELTTNRSVASMKGSWIDGTDAVRSSRLALGTYYTSTLQEGLRIDASGNQARVAIGGDTLRGTNSGRLIVYTGLAGDKGLVIRGAASQTANLQEWQNSAGTALSFITPSGSGSFKAIAIGKTPVNGRPFEVVGTISGSLLTLSNLRGCNLETSSTGAVICGTDDGTTYYAGQGLSINGSNSFSLNATITGALVRFTTLSGSTVYAKNQLLASGSLIVDGAATFNNQITVKNANNIYLEDSTGPLFRMLGFANTAYFIADRDSSSQIIFRTGGANDHMIITGAGFVGLDTPTPGSRLSVSGAVVIGNNIGSSVAKAQLDVKGTISGSLLTLSNLRGCNLETSATGAVICGTDDGTTYYAGQGLTANGTVFSLSSTITGSLVRFQTLSGSTVYAKNQLVSSGTLVTESGAYINGTSLVVQNNGNVGIGTASPLAALEIASATNALRLRAGNTSGASTQNQILFGFAGTNDYTQAIKTRHNGTSDNNAFDFYVHQTSDAASAMPTLRAFSIDGNNGGTISVGTNQILSNLNVLGNASIGSSTYMAGAAPTNGLIVEGNVGIGSRSPKAKLDVVGTISGSLLTLSNLRGCNLETSSTGAVICGTDDGTTYYAGQGLTANGNVFSLNSTITGSLVRFTTVSGSTLYAKNLLTSSGTLVTESGAFISGQVHVIQNGGTLGTDEIQISHNGTKGTIQSKDGALEFLDSVGNYVRWGQTAGLFEVGGNISFGANLLGTYIAAYSSGIDTTSGNQFAWATGTPGLSARDTGLARLSAGIVKVTDGSTGLGSLYAATLSGRTVHANTLLRSSGSLVTESGAYFDGTTMVIQAGSNRVGIGTATPAATLDVVGGINLTGTINGRLTVSNTGIIHNNNGSFVQLGGTFLYEDDAGSPANIFAQRNGTAAQTFRVYNTYTSATAYERGTFRWTSNVLNIGTENAGGGTARSLAFLTGSGERMRIDASGNIGIGTTAPKAKLDVVGTISGSLITQNGAGDNYFLGEVGIGTTTPGSLVDIVTTRYTDTSSFRMHTSDGAWAGAGTTGSMRLNPAASSGYGEIAFLNNDGTDFTAYNGLGGTTYGRLRMTSAGIQLLGNKVGIGTATPGSNLSVSGAVVIGNNIGSAVAKAQLDVKGSISGATLYISSSMSGAGLTDCDAASSTLQWDSTTERFSCDTTGGNTYTAGQGLSLSAGNAFSLNSTITGALVRFDTVSGSTLYAKNLLASSGTLVTESGAYFDGTTMVIQAGNDRVGIGTATPGQKLEVAGYIQSTVSSTEGGLYFASSSHGIRRLSGTNNVEVFTTAGAVYLSASAAGGNQLAVLSSGNVGIGTITPKAKLDVVGTLSGASLYISSSMSGAGLTDCDAASSTLQWDSTTERFSCDTTGGNTYTAGQGLSLSAGNVFTLNSTITGSLVRFTTLSGSVVKAKTTLASSGTIIAEGNITTNSGSLWQPVYRTDDGLIGYWSFSESGSTTVYDRSPQGYDGTLVGGPRYLSGKYGTAVDFDGSDDRMTIPATATFGDATLSTWFNSDVGSSQVIWDSSVDFISIQAGSSIHVDVDGTSVLFTIPTVVSGKWYHLAVVKRGAVFRVFLDGVESIDGAQTVDPDMAFTAVGSANGAGITAGPWNGKLDEMRIYNRALTEEEIRTQYLGVDSNTAIVANKFRILDTANNLLVNASSGRILEVIGTVSGSTIFANTSLRSSGSLVWEGAASGATLYLGGKLEGAGLTDCDASTQALKWDATTGRFSCGTTSNFGSGNVVALGDARYIRKSGGTMTGALTINVTGGNNSTLGLNVLNTISGSIIKAAKTLASSGSLTWEGAASGATLYIGGTIEGAGLTDCDLATQTLAWDATTKRFSCGTDSDTTYTAGQGLTLTATSFKVNSTLTGSLVRFLTISGSTVFARDTLASSGTLLVKSLTKTGSGAATFVPVEFQTGAYVYGSGASTLALDTYNTSTKQILFGYRGNFDTNLYRSASNRLQTDGSLYVLNTLSGSVVKAQKTLASSGSLVWEGAASGATLYVATSINGAGLTDCDTTTQALKWDATTGRFSCGTASNFGSGNVVALGDARYIRTSGGTMTGALTINVTGGNNATLGLNVLNTISGSVIRAQKTLASSGSLVWEGAASGATLYLGGKLEGAGLTDCDLTTQFLKWDTTTGRFGCGWATNFGSGNVIALSDPRYVNIAGDTMTGALKINRAGSASGGVLLNVLGTMSGRSLYVSGTGSSPILMTKVGDSSVGIGTANPGAALHVVSPLTELTTIFERTGVNGEGAAFPFVLRTDAQSVGDFTGLLFEGKDSNGTTQQYAGIRAGIVNPTNVFEDSSLDFVTFENGGSDVRMIISGSYIGMDTFQPSARLSVSGAAIIGLNLEAVSAKAVLDVRGSMSGSSLTISGLKNCNTIDTNANGVLVCGTDESAGSGLDTNTADERYLRRSGGTLSGALAIYVGATQAITADSGLALEVIGTASGRVLHAQNILRSSGSLLWEGAASGASLYIGGTIEGAGLLSDCDGDGQTLGWDATTKRFTCGDDDSGGGSASLVDHYVLASGDTMTGALVIQNGTVHSATETPLLNVRGTMSGRWLTVTGTGSAPLFQARNGRIGIGTSNPQRTVHIEGDAPTLLFHDTGGGVARKRYQLRMDADKLNFDSLSDAGAIQKTLTMDVDGNLVVPGTLTIQGTSLTLAAGTDVFTSGRIGLNANGNLQFNTGGAQVLTTPGTDKIYFRSTTNSTNIMQFGLTEASASGSIIKAQKSLASSGSLVWEGAASGATLYLGGKLEGAGLSDCDGDGQTLGWDATTGRFTCGDDDSGGGSVSAGQGLSLNNSVLTLNGTITGSLVRFTTLSGSTIYAKTSFASSGSLTWEGAASGASLYIGGTIEGAGLLSDCDGDGQTLGWDATTKRFTCGDDDSGSSTLTAGRGLGLNGSILTLNSTITGSLVHFTTLSGSTVFARNTLTSSGVLIVKSLTKTGSGAATFVPVEFQTGAYIYGSGASALALDAYAASGAKAPNILFGYRGNFDLGLYRTGSSNSGGLVIKTKAARTNTTAFQIVSQYNQVDNSVFKVTASGGVYADSKFNSAGADYAEWFRSSSNAPTLKQGEVVCIDVTKKNTVKRCDSDADSNVMGIVSSNPGFVGNVITGADGIIPPGYSLIGLIGQVPAKVIVENDEAIRPGDALTAASVPGYARKARAGESTVGVALEGLESGEGVVNVLISRRNQSLTVDAVEQKVLESIAAMEIEDEVELMVSAALGDLNVDEQITDEVTRQIDAISSLNEDIDAMRADIDLLKSQVAAGLSNTGTIIVETLGPGVSTGAFIHASAMEIDDTLITGGDARIGGDLSIDGTLNASSLFVPNGLTIDGGVVMNGLLETSQLSVSSGATVNGVLTINGTLNLASGATINLGSGALTINQLIVENALFVMGDITIKGLATFLGDINVQGELIVSNNQAGFAMIPQTGTSVTIFFGTGFHATPVVTASPDVPVLYGVHKSSATGFTIRLAGPATEDIMFSWHALSTGEPLTFRAEKSEDGSIIFPTDELGVPVSSNMAWNACIRNITMLDDSGQPLSCARYHDAYTWTHPDFGLTFIWNMSVTPPLLKVSDSFTVQVTESSQSIIDAINETGNEELATEDGTGTGSVTGTGETMTPPIEDSLEEEVTPPIEEVIPPVEDPVPAEEPVEEVVPPAEEPVIGAEPGTEPVIDEASRPQTEEETPVEESIVTE